MYQPCSLLARLLKKDTNSLYCDSISYLWYQHIQHIVLGLEYDFSLKAAVGLTQAALREKLGLAYMQIMKITIITDKIYFLLQNFYLGSN